MGNQGAELDGPASDRLARNLNARLQHQFLNLAQTQVEPGAEPDNMRDYLGRDTVAHVTDVVSFLR